MFPAPRMNASDTRRIEDAFSAYLPLAPNIEPHLKATLNHVLRNPGNLVRPQIVFQMALAYGIPDIHAIELAIALEYFHTASLLFDDLPCMDHAIERRGTRCTHLAFGESGAILAALALINRAYALTWKAASDCDAARQLNGLAYVEQHLGIEGLLNGQSLDLQYGKLSHDRQTTERIAVGKTVSLIRLSFVLPALLGEASANELRLLDRIAMYWGLSYQILDDLKDVLQSAAETGKTSSRDVTLDRPNIAVAIGVPDTIARLTRLMRLGDRMLRRLMITRPRVSFLGKLRGDLQQEADRIIESSCEMATRAQA
jgi:geranylgeranyl diphosphate synthase, type II